MSLPLRGRLRVLLVVLAGAAGLPLACVPDYATQGTDGGGTDASSDVVAHDTSIPDSGADVQDAMALGSDADAGEAAASEAGAMDAEGGLPTAATMSISPGPFGGWLCAEHAGTLYCWGDGPNGAGEFGYFSADAGDVPLPVPAGTNHPIDQLTLGIYFDCYRSAGVVYCRGDNSHGELGANTTNGDPSAMELVVQGLPAPVQQIAAGNYHTCSLLASMDAGFGDVYCWGDNTFGQLGFPPDGSADLFGQAFPLQMTTDAGIQQIYDAVFIASGDASSCMIRASGAVLCWGRSDLHALGGPVGPPDCYGGSGCQWDPRRSPCRWTRGRRCGSRSEPRTRAPS